MIGKLKHSLKERCPECGKPLQLRLIEITTMQKGIEVISPEERICCSNRSCYYEREIEQKRRRRKEEI